MMPNNISNTYKRKSIRLKDYDYSQAGLYYITICCYNKQHLFGEIENNQMKMNKCGEIANECWMNIPTHYPNAKLHEYVIMPNHIHGIIELLDGAVGANKYSPNITNQYSPEIAKHILPNDNKHSSNNNKTTTVATIDYDTNNSNIISGCDANGEKYSGSDCTRANVYSPLRRSPSKTIGSVIRGFKIGVTEWMQQNTNIHDVWQRNYYEHIIRDQNSYEQIAQYIIDNPENWEMDDGTTQHFK